MESARLSTLSKTVASFHNEFPPCYAHIFTLSYPLDNLDSHQYPYVYSKATNTSGGAVSKNGNGNNKHRVETVSHLRHLTYFVYSLIILTNDLESPDLQDVVQHHSERHPHLLHSRRSCPHFVLVFCEFGATKECLRQAVGTQTLEFESTTAMAYVVTFRLKPSGSCTEVDGQAPFCVSGRGNPELTSKLFIRATIAGILGFECEKPAVCVSGMKKLVKSHFEHSEWCLAVLPSFRDLFKRNVAGGSRTNPMYLTLSSVLQPVNYSLVTCPVFNNYGAFTVSTPAIALNCYTYGWLYDHDMHVLPSSDPSFVFITSDNVVESTRSSVSIYTLPLEGSVWIALTSTAAGVAVFLSMANPSRTSDGSTRLLHIGRIWCGLVCSLLEQVQSVAPTESGDTSSDSYLVSRGLKRHLSLTRCALCLWLLLSLIFTNGYKGIFKSNLCL